jgi:hypothetical protein
MGWATFCAIFPNSLGHPVRVLHKLGRSIVQGTGCPDEFGKNRPKCSPTPFLAKISSHLLPLKKVAHPALES